MIVKYQLDILLPISYTHNVDFLRMVTQIVYRDSNLDEASVVLYYVSSSKLVHYEGGNIPNCQALSVFVTSVNVIWTRHFYRRFVKPIFAPTNTIRVKLKKIYIARVILIKYIVNRFTWYLIPIFYYLTQAQSDMNKNKFQILRITAIKFAFYVPSNALEVTKS